VAAPDTGHPRVAEHPAERVVEHLQANERVIGDSDGVRAVPERPSSDPRRLGDLFCLVEPQNVVVIHHQVLPDRIQFAFDSIGVAFERLCPI
jgi:hypothetical protein